ncbi:Alpha/beta hydrolase fold-3 [Cordyceps fumosorosea ARSEF 2679]|uniref:Alpha/beta hydrolase fold-3 n=1 Tax=Cordyceps fumosorosea (strain ARSEF 2679) TaxID=1081104 RepID=A0A167QKX5_CORFA|nr:Alpha/beta hydrolase fold-3 [Cordyceps fumosorosea ARSEF 2679]OAA57732.1 Alpha/beta hydrolase fold-3 [Cordyceps fumosorosea ARSEF 2679]
MAEKSHEPVQPIHPSMEGKLDPVFVKLYNDNVAYKPNGPIDLAVLRKHYSQLYSYGTGAAPEAARTYDTTFALDDGTELTLRVYEPDTPGPWPVHVDFHGGGWGLGDLDTEAHICKHICHQAKVAVVDVAYRLVPEHPYPAQITDSWAALQYVHKHGAAKLNIKPDSISVGGVSAGGCIALALAHLARDADLPLRLVAAGTPVVDDLPATPADSPHASMRENEFAPTLNWARLAYFNRFKFPEDPAAAAKAKAEMGWFKNLLEAPNFEGLPRTVIYTAGADPLRDEGEAYARKLLENGNEVIVKRFVGVPHPFMHMDGSLRQGREFIDETARYVRLAHWD